MALTKQQRDIIARSAAGKGGDVSEEESRSIISAAITEIQSEAGRVDSEAHDLSNYYSCGGGRENRELRAKQARLKEIAERIKALSEKIEGEIEVY